MPDCLLQICMARVSFGEQQTVAGWRVSQLQHCFTARPVLWKTAEMGRSAICVTPFLSARHARLVSWGHKVCPQGTDLGVKPSAPSCPLPLPLYSGLTTERAEGQGSPPGRVALVSKEVQTTPVPMQPQTTLVSIGTQTVNVEEAQTTKTKDETKVRKRMRMRKSRFL